MELAKDEVVIIGAGPYGLSLAAHFGKVGIPHRVFGQPMSYWKDNMPKGMSLRSSWDASHIAALGDDLTIDSFQRDQRLSITRPIPLETFVRYGTWVQEHVAPEVDTRSMMCLEKDDHGFRLTLEDGERIMAHRVIVATGLGPFAWRPSEFSALPPGLVSHTSEITDFDSLSGKSIAVIGGGQSAIETAALAHEAGLNVQVILRAPQVRWLKRSLKLHQKHGLVRALLYPPTDVGPPGLNQIVARPHVWQRFPRSIGARIAYRSIRPAAAGWLAPRVANIPMTVARQVMRAATVNQQVRLTLDDGSNKTVDHVILGTGYRIDAAKYSFLSHDIHRNLRTQVGYPVLGPGYESSIPGLHFVGACSAISFGPVMRFVSGTTATSREVTSKLLRNAGRSL